MNNFFYCPKCQREEKGVDLKNNIITWVNCRDGYGTGITHIICPKCGYELAGVMQLRENSEDEIDYYKDVIIMYSDKNFIDVDKILKDIRDKLK